MLEYLMVAVSILLMLNVVLILRREYTSNTLEVKMIEAINRSRKEIKELEDKITQIREDFKYNKLRTSDEDFNTALSVLVHQKPYGPWELEHESIKYDLERNNGKLISSLIERLRKYEKRESDKRPIVNTSERIG